MFIPDAPESASDAGVAAISVAAAPAVAADAARAPWTIRVGRAVASDKHAFTRLEIDTAAQLAAMPKHAQVVFVVDASYSVGERGLAAQLAIVRSYLAHVPDAEVELVAYRRRAERVFGTFVAASGFDAALAAAEQHGALELGNGSAIDDGAQLAASLVAARPGPRRVVMLGDELWREALATALATAALAALPKDVDRPRRRAATRTATTASRWRATTTRRSRCSRPATTASTSTSPACRPSRPSRSSRSRSSWCGRPASSTSPSPASPTTRIRRSCPACCARATACARCGWRRPRRPTSS